MKIVSRASLLFPLFLAGCGTQIVPPPATGFTPASDPGNKAVIGASARALIAQFGQPRLDIRDPTARKLQFGNGQCVLDVYLYAPAERREPVASYADARLATTGAVMLWQDCARALERR